MLRASPATRLSVAGLVVTTLLLAVPQAARADDPYALAPGAATASGAAATWGVAAPGAAADATRDAPVLRARELLNRARFLDEAAISDERSAAELAARLPGLRLAAKAARDGAERASPEDREVLGARADDLEADVIISEAEVIFRRKTAVDGRRVAKALRVRAVRLVREAPVQLDDIELDSCDPPFRVTPDGHRIYRIECLK